MRFGKFLKKVFVHNYKYKLLAIGLAIVVIVVVNLLYAISLL